MRMARVNVYLPDELADAARAADLNVSRLTQEAVAAELARRSTDAWLESLDRLAPTRATHRQALDALHQARDELGSPRG